MALSKKANQDDLVAQMEAVLNDKDYRSLFDRPVIKTASAKQEEINDFQEAYNQLMNISSKLDNLGLVKSAECVMVAVNKLISESKNNRQ